MIASLPASRKLLLPVLGLFFLSGCRPLFHRQVSGSVLSVAGSAQKSDRTGSSGLRNGAHFQAGDTITSPANGVVDLLLLPGILVQLQGNSQLEIEQMNLARDGDENILPMSSRAATIRLLRGKLVASVGLARTESFLFLKIASGKLVAGPETTVLLDKNNTGTRVMCVRGKTIFRKADESAGLQVRAGFFAILSPRPDSQSQPVAHASSDAQAEVLSVLKVEKDLLRLQEDRGTSFRPW